MLTPMSLRPRRALFAALACLSVPLLATTVHSLNVTIGSDPQWPADVMLGQEYRINVTALPSSGSYIGEVFAYSRGGDENDVYPWTVWATHGRAEYGWENDAPAVVTFHMVNQDGGYYYWMGGAREYAYTNTGGSGLLKTNKIGYFDTVNPDPLD